MTKIEDSSSVIRTFVLKELFKYWHLQLSCESYLHDLIQQHSPHFQVIELTDIPGAQNWLLQKKNTTQRLNKARQGEGSLTDNVRRKLYHKSTVR